MELKGQKVLVTGADGFIGSHLVERLLEKGAIVRAFVFYNSFNSWGWLDTFPKEILEKIEIVAGDVRDQRFVDDAVKGCDFIFHLAALISIPFSYDAPDSFFDTNTKGTLNILQSARREGVKRILITSTSEVYGTAKYVPMDELHPLQAQSPYSASKISADHIGESFFRSFGVPVVIVRPFNTFGPRQSTRAVIPTIITQILSGVDTMKLGRTDTIRDFNYVKDTVDAYCAIAEKDSTTGEEINIATGIGITIGDTVKKIIEITGSKINVETDDVRLRPDSSEVERLIGSADKLKELTGWTPTFGFEKGIEETIKWYSEAENLKHFKANIYSI
ncbi:NAD-dependent dehydratase [Candidatus Campbellbacteria bacterium CG22_combo_CG10-13_8_21_14_all_36_13]|uniref:NAD-dependent dehydratase n=1 Tax=Candidatus Campbellbacteria bacterium CG22_combo_CG10-13_8_21_14_all_36_13 TaxID=1974529 RepID=A0A2H0DXG3_9BACT|nr:MAG: NAD-dependent dehydratase [Candidatus Campbellbacteria bacterium CG22_combo_CG10-13_8_21_14_all_36_13]